MEETKSIIGDTKKEILLLRENITKFRIRMMKRFDNHIYWTTGTGIGVVILLSILIKLFIIK